MASKKELIKQQKELKKTRRISDEADNALGISSYKPIKNRYVLIVLLVYSFVIYGNTIFNDYTLDDGIVITKNQFTKKGFAGIWDILSYDSMAGEHGTKVDFVAGGRYRPLSIVTFAIEYHIFGLNKGIEVEKNETLKKVYHFDNIILYALSGFLIYIIFMKLLPSALYRPFIPRWYYSVPFLTALLFLSHPVHTEIVANIKGRDEILALLGVLASFWFSLKYIENKRPLNLFYSFICFFLGLMSKENAITFLAIIPIGIYLFTDATGKENRKTWIPVIAASAVFIFIRYKTVGFSSQGTAHELMNNSFVDADTSQYYGTVFYTFMVYLRLLFFPYKLTWDYYPYYIPLVRMADIRAIVPLFIYGALGVIAFLGILRKQKKILSFGVLIYFATLSPVSNLFFSIGSFMSERFIYMSSIGFCLIVSYFLVRKLPEYLILNKKINQSVVNNSLMSVLVVVVVLFSIRTITRNQVWKDNFTLFTHDVITSSESAKGNTTAGEQLVIRGMDLQKEGRHKEAEPMFELAIEYLEKALRIHPRYVAARLDLGIAYEKYKKDYGKAIDMYISTIQLKPNYDKAYSNLAVMFMHLDSVELRFKTYERLYQLNPNRADVNYVLGSLNGAYKRDIETAIKFLVRALQIDPNLADAYSDLGVAFGMKGQYDEAIKVLEKAYSINPKSPVTLSNLSASYTKIGNAEKSEFYKKQYEALLNEYRMRSAQMQNQQNNQK